MIVRYHLRCDHCDAVTMLRMGVGHQAEHTADFECGSCGHPVTLTMRLDQEAGRVLGADSRGAKQVEVEHYDHTLTVYPGFGTSAAPADQMGFPGGEMSPFVLSVHSEKGQEALHLARWARASHESARDLQRLITNYQREEWERFSSGMAEYLPDLSTDEPIDRNRALYQLLELTMAPLCTSSLHVARIKEATEVVSAAFESNPSAYSDFVEANLANGRMTTVLHDVLDIYPRFLGLLPTLGAALREWDPEAEANSFPEDREIRGLSDFDSLKTLYVDAYEALARALTPILGVVNLKNRGDPDSVPTHPWINKNKPFAKDLNDLHGKSNAPKLDLFLDEPAIGGVLGPVDPKLRNAAGHKSIRFSDSKNLVEYTIDRAGKTAELTLGQFMIAVLELVRAMHVVSHYLKIILVHYYLRDEIAP